MKSTLETLWNEYISEECSNIESSEERNLLKKSAELHKKINDLLTAEQNSMIEEYIETLYEAQNIFGQKAFLKGCHFATSFLFEASTWNNNFSN